MHCDSKVSLARNRFVTLYEVEIIEQNFLWLKLNSSKVVYGSRSGSEKRINPARFCFYSQKKITTQ